MPPTLKQHHCPGDKVWIGDVSPGGCRTGWVGRIQYGKKHQIPCKNGCAWYLQSCVNSFGCQDIPHNARTQPPAQTHSKMAHNVLK
jgi:S-ribosylhomocysteine lyase LuxS involved in autoinducer biosynthesis